ncbi:MAG: hypothetical protein H6Q21_270 [Bacteroidetes bacterium]|nr:hypothetical protein [Bacteroidota bacterium]
MTEPRIKNQEPGAVSLFSFIKGKPNIVIKVHALIKIKIPFALSAVYTGMSINKKDFIENLDLVLEIFRRFKEKMADGKTTVDQAFVKNFDDIIRNYQIIREEIPEDLVSKFGMPIQLMAIQLVEQLRKELDGEAKDSHDTEKETRIDDMLRNANLSDAEIDDLLDKRLAIQKRYSLS